MLTIHRPLRVAVLCSHRAPGLLYLLNRTPDRGVTFEIVCVASSEATFDEEVRVERRGIPTLGRPIRAFFDARRASVLYDGAVRRDYERQVATAIEPYLPDLVLLDGYRYLLTPAFLGLHPARIINLHFSDLTLRRSNGGPEFPGPRAVRDSLIAGRHDTRATVHLVNEGADDGPPIVRSWPFVVSPLVDALRHRGADEVVSAYTFAHEQWMMLTASGPLIAAALRLIATGAIDLSGLAASRAPSPPWELDAAGELLAPRLAGELAGELVGVRA